MQSVMQKRVILLSLLIFILIAGFGQYKSLIESPLYVKGKKNFYQDSVSKVIIPIEFLDSLYKENKNQPFQVLGYVSNGDSAIWKVAFIDAESISRTYREKWLNQTFPLTNFTDLNGKTVKKQTLEGKNLVINCWSITCGPCIKEMPELNLLVDSLKKKKFYFLALTFDKPEPIINFFKSQKLKDFLETDNPEFKFDIIPNQEVLLTSMLAVKSYPTTFIVNKNGKIIEIFDAVNLDKNGKPKTYAEIMQAIQKLD